MVAQWGSEWEADTEAYTAGQVEAVLRFCGIEPESENAGGFLAYCPFHSNTDSPAFGINYLTGRWSCFNPACGQYGSLEELVRRLKDLNPFEITRLFLKYENETGSTPAQRLQEAMENKPEFSEYSQERITRLKDNFWDSIRAQNYMVEQRLLLPSTLNHFEVGYSKKRDMITVPMHDPNGMPVGFIGRSIQDKIFKNTDGLPKSKTAWNFHRAKQYGDTVIIVESSFDAMRLHQVGYPNVIALLGGHLSRYHTVQIDRSFNTIVNMTDFDKRGKPRPNCHKCSHLPMVEGVRCVGHRPGRELAWSIQQAFPYKRVLWAAYDDNAVYPHGAKDVGDMTDEEIVQCVHNAISHFEYSRWGIEDLDLLVANHTNL